MSGIESNWIFCANVEMADFAAFQPLSLNKQFECKFLLYLRRFFDMAFKRTESRHMRQRPKRQCGR